MQSKSGAIPAGTPRLALYLFLVTSTFGFLQPFVPLYMSAAGLSRGQIGLVTGVGAGLAMLIQPILGRVSDQIDSRRPFIAGAAVCSALAYLAFPFADGWLQFLILTAVGMNGTTYLQVAGGVLIGRMVSAMRGGAAYANVRVWGSVGYIVVSLAAGLLLSLSGAIGDGRGSLDVIFRTGPWLFVAIATLALWLPDPKNEKTDRPLPAKGPLSGNLIRFLAAYFLYTVALYGASPYISLFLKSLGATGIWITGTFAAGVVVEVLVMRKSGALSDAYGRRPALALAFLLLPFRLLLYMPAPNPAWVLAVQSLHGINFGIVGAVAVAFANDLASDRGHGTAQARLAAVAGLATAVGPALLGLISDQVGLRGLFGVAAGIAALAATVLVLGVEDSHPTSRPVASRGPAFLRPFLRLLDAPPWPHRDRPDR